MHAIEDNLTPYNEKNKNLYKKARVDHCTTTKSGAGAIPLTHDIVFLTTTGANALTLAAGKTGQEITIVMVVDGGDGTLTPTALVGGTTITFDAVGETATLVSNGTSWYVKSLNAATLA